MNMKSTSPQMTSVQNCLTAFEMMDPLHTTGSVSSGRRKLTLMRLIPVFDLTGRIPIPFPTAFSCIPKALPIEGPVMSASRIAAWYSCL